MTTISRFLNVRQNTMHVDFVIKFLHGIRAWPLSDSEQSDFWERFEGVVSIFRHLGIS
jgi:hypothetical protein